MLTAIAFIGLAGAGSAIRFLAADRWPGGHRGTLLVNVAGSLLLGLLTGAGSAGCRGGRAGCPDHLFDVRLRHPGPG